jgi:dolichyldiphosphatase
MSYLCVDHLGDGYGMPSSHSQFIWYFAVYGSLYLFKYIHLDHSIWKLLISTAMFTLAVLVSISR